MGGSEEAERAVAVRGIWICCLGASAGGACYGVCVCGGVHLGGWGGAA